MNGEKLIELKEELFAKGYTTFNIKDIGEELYNELEIAIPPNSLNPNQFTNLRNTIINVNNKPIPEFESDILNKPFDELEIIKDKILNNYSFKNGYNLEQIWFHSEVKSRKILNFRYNLYSLFYEINTGDCGTQLSLYNDGCYLRNHQDGYSNNRHCAMLIYLSTDWDETKGGELIINNNVIVPPIYGNVAILDFTKHNSYHMVNKVNGFNRYCLISFCNPIINLVK